MSPSPVPAGLGWVEVYPTSRAVADLSPAFRPCVAAFHADLAARGCTVTVAATRRPEQRAWLMRGAWDVAHSGLAAAPRARADIPIVWTVAGAQEMVRGYGLLYRPSLTSLHLTGDAIDQHISGWTGSAEDLYALGASHGVHKLVVDPPHWSSTGH